MREQKALISMGKVWAYLQGYFILVLARNASAGEATWGKWRA